MGTWEWELESKVFLGKFYSVVKRVFCCLPTPNSPPTQHQVNRFYYIIVAINGKLGLIDSIKGNKHPIRLFVVVKCPGGSVVRICGYRKKTRVRTPKRLYFFFQDVLNI